jgi:hypothetical protein
MSEIMRHICISNIYTRDRVRMLSTMGTLSLQLWSEFIDTVIFLSFAYGWIQMLREILIWHF